MAIITRWAIPPDSWWGRPGPAAGVGDADAPQHLHGALVALGLPHALVHAVHLGDLVAGAVAGVQRRVRLLEHHRDAVAPEIAQLLVLQVQDVDAVEPHRALDDATGRRHQPQGGEHGDALPRARLADEAEHLALVDAEVDPVHRFHDAVAGEEPGAQVSDLQQRLASLVEPGGRGRRAGRHRAG
jgi:hypothetical protein